MKMGTFVGLQGWYS